MGHLLIAHRGDTNNYAENTPEAFASAFSKGADGIELDVQEQNGELIVVHNYMYDRSANYPKLDDILKRFVSSGRLEIEIKPLSLSFLKPLEKALSPYTNANIELTTSVIGLVAYLRPAFKDFDLGIIFQDREFEDWMFDEGFVDQKLIKLMQLYRADVAHMPRRIVSPELVTKLHKLGMRAHVHIPKKSTQEQLHTYHELSAMLIDQSTIDDINLLDHIKN